MAWRRQVVIGALILVAVVLVAGIFWTAARLLPGLGPLHQGAPVVHDVAVSSGQTLTLGVVTASAVKVTRGTGSQAVVTTTPRWRGGNRPPAIWSERQGANGPVIDLQKGQPWSWGCCRGSLVGVTVALPPGVDVALSVVTGPVVLSGNIPRATVHDVTGAVSVSNDQGVLALNLVTGQAVVSGLRDPGALSVSVVTGGIVVSDAQVAGEMQVSTVNGTQRLTAVHPAGQFLLHSVNGAILYSGTGGTGGSVSTVNGAVQMQLAPPASGHYVVVDRSGSTAWPVAAGPELGQIVLSTTNGSATLTSLGTTGGNG